MSRRTLLAIAALLVTACSTTRPAGVTTPRPATSGPATPAPAAPAAPAPSTLRSSHVFVIVMENHSYVQALAQPYTNGLAAQYAVATDYHAISHPSLPNYLALAAGSTFGVADDNYHRLPATGIGQELTARGIPWRAYMEGLPAAGCLQGTASYAVRHNPFAYFGGDCPANVVPLTALDADLATGAASFSWITPDLCHDGHDCSARRADDFLAGLVPKIIASPGWQRDGLLLITWDEDDGNSSNRVAALVVARGLTAHLTARPHDHYSLLAMVEDWLGVPRLNQARDAVPMDELFQ